MTRKEFVGGFAASLVSAELRAAAAGSGAEDELDRLQVETDLVKSVDYGRYLKSGETDGFAALERLESGFEKALGEIKSCEVGKTPAVWHIYNMGYVVKTKDALFSIDLNHRRDTELAKMLDFALITHNHPDHFREPFYQAMDKAGKTVISNFKDNFGAADWRKGGMYWAAGGFTRAAKTFKIKDVEIRTALTDHSKYLVDFTTTFEIRVGGWKLFHSGDCGNADKLKTIWGSPDVWLVFPGCGIDIAAAYKRIKPKKMCFGHLWELSHTEGRLSTGSAKASRKKVEALGGTVNIPLWGERIC